MFYNANSEPTSHTDVMFTHPAASGEDEVLALDQTACMTLTFLKGV